MRSTVVILVLLGIWCYAQETPEFQEPTTASGSNVVVTVGDYQITKEQVFDLFVKRYKASAYEVIQEMVIRWIIRQECKQEGIQIEKQLLLQKTQEDVNKSKEQIQRTSQQTWEEYLKAQEMTDKQFRQESYMRWKYKLALERLVRLAEYRETRMEARHIMVKTREKAQEVLAKLRQKADFAALARQESLAATGKDGGMLPPLLPGDIHSSLEGVLLTLKPNEISGVVQSPWGFHVMQLLKIYPARQELKWAQAQAELLESLDKSPVMPRDIQRWLKKMEIKHKIKQMFR